MLTCSSSDSSKSEWSLKSPEEGTELKSDSHSLPFMLPFPLLLFAPPPRPFMAFSYPFPLTWDLVSALCWKLSWSRSYRCAILVPRLRRHLWVRPRGEDISLLLWWCCERVGWTCLVQTLGYGTQFRTRTWSLSDLKSLELRLPNCSLSNENWWWCFCLVCDANRSRRGVLSAAQKHSLSIRLPKVYASSVDTPASLIRLATKGGMIA